VQDCGVFKGERGGEKTVKKGKVNCPLSEVGQCIFAGGTDSHSLGVRKQRLRKMPGDHIAWIIQQKYRSGGELSFWGEALKVKLKKGSSRKILQ